MLLIQPCPGFCPVCVGGDVSNRGGLGGRDVRIVEVLNGIMGCKVVQNLRPFSISFSCLRSWADRPWARGVVLCVPGDENRVSVTGNAVWGFISSSTVEMQFVGFTRFLSFLWSTNVAVSVSRLPKNPGHRSWNAVFRAENGIFGLISSSPIEEKFVDFTRVLTIFWSPIMVVSVTKLPENQDHRS